MKLTQTIEENKALLLLDRYNVIGSENVYKSALRYALDGKYIQTDSSLINDISFKVSKYRSNKPNLISGVFPDEFWVRCEKQARKEGIKPTDNNGFDLFNYCRTKWNDLKEYETKIGEFWKSNGFHLMYAFEDNPAKYTGSFSAKRVLHNIAFETWSRILLQDKENVMLWAENEAMKAVKSKTGLAPTASQMISEINQSFSSEKIGGAFLAALPAIITAIGTATLGIASLISSIKRDDKRLFESTVSAYGSASFGPEKEDFYKKQDNDVLPYILLGGAGLFLLSNK